MKEIVRALWRAVRVAVALAAGQFISNLMQQPAVIGLGITPIISGLCKWIRDKFPKLWWLPI